MMSPDGPVIDPDALRKNVSGIDLGSIPASLTWEKKLVICATTRQGAVTGDTRLRLSGGTTSALDAAASMAARSANSSAVAVASVLTFAAPVAVWTHQASAVRKIERVMTRLLSSVRSGGENRIRCQPEAH